ncbi:hypothetical protein MHYP_G00273940 [Metynnis hypsauchen]
MLALWGTLPPRNPSAALSAARTTLKRQQDEGKQVSKWRRDLMERWRRSWGSSEGRASSRVMSKDVHIKSYDPLNSNPVKDHKHVGELGHQAISI